MPNPTPMPVPMPMPNANALACSFAHFVFVFHWPPAKKDRTAFKFSPQFTILLQYSLINLPCMH